MIRWNALGPRLHNSWKHWRKLSHQTAAFLLYLPASLRTSLTAWLKTYCKKLTAVSNLATFQKPLKLQFLTPLNIAYFNLMISWPQLAAMTTSRQDFDPFIAPKIIFVLTQTQHFNTDILNTELNRDTTEIIAFGAKDERLKVSLHLFQHQVSDKICLLLPEKHNNTKGSHVKTRRWSDAFITSNGLFSGLPKKALRQL